MVIAYGIIAGRVIILNGLVFIIGVCCIIMGIILFIMTIRGMARKKLRGTIREIKANMVSKIAVVQVADLEGARELEAELRSRSKVGDRIHIMTDKKTGKYFEFNPQRLVIVGCVFIAVGLLIILPGVLMTA